MPSTWPNTLPAFTLSLPEVWDDPTLRSETDGGYQITRARYSRMRRTFKRAWSALTATHYAMLITFYKTTVVAGSDYFSWTTDTDSTSVNVRFSAPLKATLVAPATSGRVALYQVEVEFAEV